MTRRGDWMQTFTGRQFWPMDPRPEDIFIEDIAHALSMQCRYAGHCIRFYSVAEHSVHVARAVSPENRLWALLHDASEAYLLHIPRPVKPWLDGYEEAEAAVILAVMQRFNLLGPKHFEVAEVDRRIIGDERANLSPCVTEWRTKHEPLGVELRFWSPAEAEREFLAAYERYIAGGVQP